MTTKPMSAAALQLTVRDASHAQRCIAIANCMNSLIELGFYEDEPISGGDAVEDVAKVFDEATGHDLKPGLADKFAAPNDVDALYAQYAEHLVEARAGDLNPEDENVDELIQRTLKHVVAASIAAASEKTVLKVATYVFMELRALGFHLEEPINGGDAVEDLAKLFNVVTKELLGHIPFEDSATQGLSLLESCCVALHQYKAEEEESNGILAFVHEGKPASMHVERSSGNCWGRIVYDDRRLAHVDVHVDDDWYDYSDDEAARAFVLEAKQPELDKLLGEIYARIGAPAQVQVPAEPDPNAVWHLFSVEACGGDDDTGDQYAHVSVSALADSVDKAEQDVRAIIQRALPNTYSITTCKHLCQCDRAVLELVHSDAFIGLDAESSRQDAVERPRF